MLPTNIHETLINALAIAAVRATQNVTDGNEQTKQLIRIKEARDYLEQLQTQPTWEPLPPGVHEYDGGSVIIDEDGFITRTYSMSLRDVTEGKSGVPAMPYRLCRLVQQQPQKYTWQPCESCSGRGSDCDECKGWGGKWVKQPQENDSHE